MVRSIAISVLFTPAGGESRSATETACEGFKRYKSRNGTQTCPIQLSCARVIYRCACTRVFLCQRNGGPGGTASSSLIARYRFCWKFSTKISDSWFMFVRNRAQAWLARSERSRSKQVELTTAVTAHTWLGLLVTSVSSNTSRHARHPARGDEHLPVPDHCAETTASNWNSRGSSTEEVQETEFSKHINTELISTFQCAFVEKRSTLGTE